MCSNRFSLPFLSLFPGESHVGRRILCSKPDDAQTWMKCADYQCCRHLFAFFPVFSPRSMTFIGALATRSNTYRWCDDFEWTRTSTMAWWSDEATRRSDSYWRGDQTVRQLLTRQPEGLLVRWPHPQPLHLLPLPALPVDVALHFHPPGVACRVLLQPLVALAVAQSRHLWKTPCTRYNISRSATVAPKSVQQTGVKECLHWEKETSKCYFGDRFLLAVFRQVLK